MAIPNSHFYVNPCSFLTVFETINEGSDEDLYEAFSAGSDRMCLDEVVSQGIVRRHAIEDRPDVGSEADDMPSKRIV